MSRHVSTNIPSARTTVKSAVSSSSRPTTTLFSSASSQEFINYSASDTYRKETIRREEEARRVWTAKFDPWLIEGYRQMYDNIAKVHGISHENCVISLKRREWQQPENVFPPLHKRLTGQRRRRQFGAFPETENDKIGWRVLPHQSLEKPSMSHPLPIRYKFSNYPLESFH